MDKSQKHRSVTTAEDPPKTSCLLLNPFTIKQGEKPPKQELGDAQLAPKSV